MPATGRRRLLPPAPYLCILLTAPHRCRPHPACAEMKIGEDHLGGLVEEVTPDMKLPKERKKK